MLQKGYVNDGGGSAVTVATVYFMMSFSCIHAPFPQVDFTSQPANLSGGGNF